MQNLQNELIDLLKHEDNLVIEGHLNKNKIVELVLKVEPQLISILVKSETFKKHFFQEVESVLVFDKIKFQRFVNNKSFLPDSYTAFKNKIGLITNDDDLDNYISSSNNVVLAWPHKDCVLEGGQTKEDQRRNEIFWNETLAPDSVDRLLDAKVLTNFKKIDSEGEHLVTEINGDENLIIKGNNLLGLASLLKTHRGKIKAIYIDPPYNTGSDSFGYNDSFNHSTWLTFMKNRLVIARELLSNTGLIFVHNDSNEFAHLKVLMDEIFKPINYIDTIISRATPNARDYGHIGKMHEYIHLYAKDYENAITYLIPDKDKKFSYKDGISEFNIHPLYNSNVNFNIHNRKNLYYPFYINTSVVDKNGFFEIGLENKEGSIEVFPPKSVKDNVQFVWRWGKEKSLENLNIEIVGYKTNTDEYRIVQKMRTTAKVARSIWDETEMSNRRATEDLQKLFNKKIFAYPKSEYLIKRVIEMSTVENDIILDFHLGSGTTAAIAHKMGRKYIGIEQMDYIETVAVERLKKVIEGEQGGVSIDVNWQGGGSFVYAELKQYNQSYVDLIQDAKSKEELISVWNQMEETAFLSFQFDKKTFNDRIDAFKTAPVEEMKQYLIEILDKNQLYVNLSEIDDEMFGVSEQEKVLNNQFYSKK